MKVGRTGKNSKPCSVMQAAMISWMRVVAAVAVGVVHVLHPSGLGLGLAGVVGVAGVGHAVRPLGIGLVHVGVGRDELGLDPVHLSLQGEVGGVGSSAGPVHREHRLAVTPRPFPVGLLAGRVLAQVPAVGLVVLGGLRG